MPFSNTALSAAADAIADLVDEVGLHTGDPGASGTSSEVTGNNYSRASTNGAAWTESNGVSSNNAVIQFAVPSGAWGTVSHFSLWDGNTFIGSAALTTSRAVVTGADVEFAVGDLTITVPSS